MYIDRMSEVVKSYEDGKRPDGINDYLEMFHIVQFIEHGKYPADCPESRIAGVKLYKGKVVAYFSHLKTEEFPALYAEAERGYQSTIWQIIDTFKIKGLISEPVLREILAEHPWKLKNLLKYSWIVEKNNALLAELLKENEHTAGKSPLARMAVPI